MPRKRIALVIDDDVKAQSTISSTFWRIGWADPTLVKTGADALALLAHSRDSFDAIVVDQNLPLMTGLEIIEALNTTGASFPPIIMLTGNHDPAVELRAGELGAVFLSKNDLSEERLTELLEQLLGKSQGK